MHPLLKRAITLIAMSFSVATSQAAVAVNFNEHNLIHGDYLVDNQVYQDGSATGFSVDGWTPQAGNGYNVARIFDSDTVGITDDTDLQFSYGNRSQYKGGNSEGTSLGNLMILQELPKQNEDPSNGIFNPWNDPDDNRKGGDLTFIFNSELTEFGFSFIDHEGTPNGGQTTKLKFIDSISGEFAVFNFKEFAEGSGSQFEQAGVKYGDNYANNFESLTLADAQTKNSNLTRFDQVMFWTDGSGAVGGISYTAVPEPSSLLLVAAALPILLRRKRN